MKVDDLKNAKAVCQSCEWVGNKYRVLIKQNDDNYYCPDCGGKIMWQGTVTIDELFEEMKKHYLK